jgi:glycosyltransferase involved in cell wall biosynthesis
MPQLYSYGLATMPVDELLIYDARLDRCQKVRRARLLREAARAPVDIASGLWCASQEAVRFRRVQARRELHRPLRRRGPDNSVVALWPGASGSSVGGSITHISGILKALRASGLAVNVITLQEAPAQLADAADVIEVVPPESSPQRLLGFSGALTANPRIIGAAGDASPSFVYQRHRAFMTAGLELAERWQVPLVLEWNGSEVWARANWKRSLPGEHLLNPLMAAMEREVARHADLVVAVSRHAADMALEAGAPADHVIVVPNGVDLEEIDRAVAGLDDRPGDGVVVGWIGSFGAWHGAEVLIEAMARLPGNVRLLMIGDGPNRSDCELIARTLGVADRIEWAGTLRHGQALRRLARCDLLASPHVPLRNRPFFGSPTKLFEYMGLGLPIVASDLEQLGEVIEEGRTGVLVQPGDVASLAAGITNVLSRPDRGAELGRNARAEAERSHTWLRRGELILARLDAC